MSAWTLVSWYTPEYEEPARLMEESARRVGIENIRFYQRESSGDWSKNVTHKAGVLMQALAEINSDIVYVDADATFNYYPALFDCLGGQVHHFAAHWHCNTELLGGTLWLRNCLPVCKMVESVHKEQQQTGEWAQKIMQRHWSSNYCYYLPPEYCCISDTMRSRYPGLAPVIEHHQLSRRVHRRGLTAIDADEASKLMEVGN